MPSFMTIWRWRQKDAEFDAAYLDAMQLLTTKLADEILELSDKATPETAQVRRLQVDARRWYCSKFYPRLFGDKPEVNVNVHATSNTLVIGDAERAALIAKREAALAAHVDVDVLPAGETAGETTQETLALPSSERKES